MPAVARVRSSAVTVAVGGNGLSAWPGRSTVSVPWPFARSAGAMAASHIAPDPVSALTKV